jgi:hypothetical protein
MADSENPDIVDVFFALFIRPLGNLVITYANAEAALIEFLAEILDGDENAARELLAAPDHKEKTLRLIGKAGFEGYELSELNDGLAQYWSDRERRNRYMHDEWYAGIFPGPTVIPGTRGVPRKKGAQVVWDQPTPQDVWQLGLSFREHASLFSASAYHLRRRRKGECAD